MIAFIEEHRDGVGVEPVCKVFPIAQSTFYAHVAIARNPDLASDRAKRDVDLSPEIKRVWEENNEVYGIRKVWHQLQREKFTIARCTVARLMKRSNGPIGSTIVVCLPQSDTSHQQKQKRGTMHSSTR